MLQPGDKRDVPDGPFGGRRVEQVLQHAAVDRAVLRLRFAARPRRIEDVRRCGASHCRRDGVCVSQVGDERGDALVEILWTTAQARHLPAVGEESACEIAAADSRDAGDERPGCHRLLFPAVTATARSATCSMSGPVSPPRRPRTTQIARTASGPSLIRRCGVDDGNVIESPDSSTYSSKPTTMRSVPLRMCPNSWPLWRTSSSSLDAPPGAYVASRNSTSSSPQNISRSQRTPELSWMAGRSAARWMARPGSVRTGDASSWPAGSLKSTSSTVTPYSEASA